MCSSMKVVSCACSSVVLASVVKSTARSLRSGGGGAGPGGPVAGGGDLVSVDLPLEDLAGRSLGQGLDEVVDPRDLVGRDPLLEPAAQLGGELLAAPGVGDADHRDFANVRVPVEHLLDLARVDVVTTADHEVLHPVDDPQVAVLVHPADVAGEEPLPLEDGVRGLRALP